MKKVKRKDEQAKYISRLSEFEVLKNKKISKKYETKTRRLSDGSYKREVYFERKGNVIHQVTRWKITKSKKEIDYKYDARKKSVVQYEKEISQNKWLEAQIKRINKSKGKKQITASFQKFYGKYEGKHRSIKKGKVSKAIYIKSMEKKEGKKFNITKFRVEIDDAKDILEAQHLMQYDTFKRVKKRKHRRKK